MNTIKDELTQSDFMEKPAMSVSAAQTIKHLITSLVIAGFLVSTTAFGEIIAIVSQNEAVEATAIKVDLDKTLQNGKAEASGCTGCPKEFSVDTGTQFFKQGKPVSRKDLKGLSGKPGTLIFDVELKRATKVLY